jgi:hypothetical protein
MPSHCHYVPPPPSVPARSSPTSTKHPTPSSPLAPSLVTKQAALANVPWLSGVPTELGEYIDHDVRLLQSLGWHGLIAHCWPLSIFSQLDNVPHPAHRLLCLYKHCGTPVKFSTLPWTRLQVKRSLSCGPHKSAHEYLDYFEEEFVNMINKGQWVVLPYLAVKDLPGLRISPPGVIPQCNCCPRWIVDYSWWDVNANTLPFVAMEAMQFGHVLD